MIRNWKEFNIILDLFTDDAERSEGGGDLGIPDVEFTEGTPRFSEPLRIMGFNFALNMLCTHTPRAREMTLVIDEGNQSAVMPDDLYAIDAIYDAGRELWWRPMRYEPGDVRYQNDDLPEYWVWGRKIHLESSVDYGSSDLRLFYWAYYPEIRYRIEKNDEDKNVVVMTDEVIYAPLWAESALAHMTTAFCWQPGACMAADINEYKISVDSGNPLQNPRSQQAREHLFWWNVILDQHARPQIFRHNRQ